MKRFIQPYRLTMAASAILAALGTAAGLVPFVVAYHMARLAIEGGLTQGAVLAWAALAFAGILAKVGLNTVATALSHRAAYHMLHDIRLALIDRLTRAPLGLFIDRPAGALKKTINEDVEQIEEVLAHGIPDLFAALAVPISCAVVLAFVDWRLALASVVMFPLLVVVYPVTLVTLKPLSERNQQALAGLRSATIEFLQGMKVIRAFLAADSVPGRFDNGIEELRESTRRLSTAALLPGALMLVGLRANILLLLPIGGWLFLQGQIDAGTLVFFLLMGMGVNASAYKLLMTAGTFGMRIASAGKQINELLDAPQMQLPRTPQAPDGFAVEFQGVGFAYPAGGGVHDISFAVPQGTHLGIVGPSGGGKTTLARLLGRFWDVQQGAITIGGVDIRDMDPDVLMATVSFILQDPWLLDGTIRDNILAGRPGASDAQVMDAARRARVLDFADEMAQGLDSPVGEGGRLLSGGQRQRVTIARAMLRDTPILVMDEATSALDPDTEELVLEALAELSRGRTTIAIAHRLDTIRAADRILFVADGTITAQGSHRELLVASPDYARLCTSYEAAGGWSLARHDGMARPVPDLPPESRLPVIPPLPQARGALSLFFGLLGPDRRLLVRRALPLLFAEGFFMGAPVAATVMALIDVQAGTLTMGRVWAYTALVAACFAMQGLFNVAGNRALWRVQTNTTARLQTRLGQHLRRVPLGVLKTWDTGRLEVLITQLVPDLNFITPSTQMMRAVVGPLVSLCLMIWLDWRLALAVVATLPLFLLVVAFSDRIHLRSTAAQMESRERIGTRVLEFLQGMPTLRALNIGPRQMRGLSDTLEHHRDVSLSTVTSVAPTVAVAMSVLDLGFCLILLAGGLLVVSGGLAPAAFLIFLVVGLVFYGPIGDAFELAAYRRQQERAMQKVAEVLDLPVLSEPATGKTPANLDVSYENVSFAYGDKTALRGLDVHLPGGGLYAFVGQSGSGKSTALDLLARFLDVDSGAIRVGGVDIRDLTQDQRARLFAIVFQDNFLFNDTIAANLAMARPGVSDDQMVAACRAAHCHDFIMALPQGYDSPVGEGGARLSGGQRQRLAIARAILKDAPIVLLDEATAAIDPEAEADIRAALGQLCAGRTVIVIAHRLRSVVEADRIVVFDAGRVEAAGSHAELMQGSAVFRRLVDASDRLQARELRQA